jgi:hypothetical protein
MTDMSAYDRDFSGTRDDYRFQGGGEYSGNLGYRGTEPGWSTAYNYDRDFSYGRPRGVGYDREFGARRGLSADMGGRMDYDRDMSGWQHRQQTDTGDPFGDRQSRTPIRVMRGGFDRGDMDRGDWGRGQMARGGGDADYGRDYRGWNQGIGDEPYYNTGDFRRNPNRF